MAKAIEKLKMITNGSSATSSKDGSPVTNYAAHLHGDIGELGVAKLTSINDKPDPISVDPIGLNSINLADATPVRPPKIHRRSASEGFTFDTGRRRSSTQKPGHRRTRSYGIQDLQANYIEVLEAQIVLEDTTANTHCGLGRFRPAFLQRFATKRWLLFWMCWFCTVQGLLVNGLFPSALSTIERRFGFSTSMLGRITQFYDIGYVLCCIPVSYFGGRHSKPLFLGAGLVIMGCGSLLFTMPHMISDAYLSLVASDSSASSNICANISSTSDISTTTSSFLTTTVDCGLTSAPSRSANREHYYTIFRLAHFLHGVGATPLFTLGVSYIDENVKPALSSMYLGIFYAFAIFGPAIGFLLQGFFLRYHTDFLLGADLTTTDESDPTWVGAWWIGFLIASLAVFLAVLPVMSFPRVLPGAINLHRTRVLRSDSVRKKSVDVQRRRRGSKSTTKEDGGKSTSRLPPPPLKGDEGGGSARPLLSPIAMPVDCCTSEHPSTIANNNCTSGTTATAPLLGGGGSGQPYVIPSLQNQLSVVPEESAGSGTPSPSVQGPPAPKNPQEIPDGTVEVEDEKKEIPWWIRLWMDFRHIPTAVLKIITNPCYMLITLGLSVDGLIVTGASTFMAKYLERQFNVAPSKANVLIGCIMVPMAGMGTMVSGFLVKHFSLSCAKTIQFSISFLILSLLLSPMYLIYCDHPPVAGIETAYPSSSVGNGTNVNAASLFSLTASCNAHCRCSHFELNPVCADSGDGEQGVPFYSPCYAGCRETYENSRLVYTGCKCAGGPEVTVRKGWCETQCGGLIGFLVLFAPMCFFTFAIGVPLLSVILRCVDYSERSFALGIQWIMVRCIGTIPAPVLFGWLFDVSCTGRVRRACMGAEDEGSCYSYDNRHLAELFLAFSVIGQTVTLLFLVFALLCYRRKLANSTDEDENQNNQQQTSAGV